MSDFQSRSCLAESSMLSSLSRLSILSRPFWFYLLIPRRCRDRLVCLNDTSCCHECQAGMINNVAMNFLCILFMVPYSPLCYDIMHRKQAITGTLGGVYSCRQMQSGPGM
nr:MAG TPA: hypothetical protein [Caudoviricetes sp.]